MTTFYSLIPYSSLNPRGLLQVHLIRGNHETPQVNSTYGFLADCRIRFDVSVYDAFNEVFAWLPLAGLVGEKIFCCHGGISRSIDSLSDIRAFHRPIYDVPPVGPLCDLMWADPDEDVTYFQANPRGCSQLFGVAALTVFLEKLNIDLVVRAHQVIRDGYEFFGRRQLVTVFSAPNYEGSNNAGAVMQVSKTLQCKFSILKPDRTKKP